MIARWFLISVIVALFTAPCLHAKWFYFRSPHFELYANGHKDAAARVLNRLEQSRTLFTQANAVEFDAPHPTRIIILNSLPEMERLSSGGPIPFVRYLHSRNRSHIVFLEAKGTAPLITAVHQYIHLRTFELGLPYPPWLSEGFAEFYSTALPRGDQVRVGMRPDFSHSVDRAGVVLSVREAMNITDYDWDAVYSKHAKRDSVYATGWALVSYLSLSDGYRQRFDDFLLAILSGESSVDALREVYSKETRELQIELERYLEGPTINVRDISADWNLTDLDLSPRPVGEIEIRLVMAELNLRSGAIDDARAELEWVLDREPDNSEALIALAGIEPGIEDVDRYARAIELGSRNPYLHLDYARALIDRAAPRPQIVEALSDAARLTPDTPAANFVLAAYARRDGAAEEEAYYLQRIGRADPLADYIRSVRLGELLTQLGRSLQARVALNRAAQHVRTFSQLRAVAALRQASEVEALEAARADVEAGRLEPAQQAIQELLKVYPGAGPVLEAQADLQRASGDLAAAEAIAAKALRLRRTSAFHAVRFRGDALERIRLLDAAGFDEAAAEHFQKYVELRPRDTAIHRSRAYSLANQGLQLELAVRLAERAAELAPDADLIQDTLAWAYVQAGRADDALPSLARLVRRRPDWARVRYHYGVALSRTGDKQAAAQALQRALSFDDLSPSFRNRIESALAELSTSEETPPAAVSGSSPRRSRK